MDVAAWLQGLGLERYVQAFLENRIEADILPSLTMEDLKDLGVTLVGDRRRLLDAISALGAAVPPAATPVAAPGAPAPAEAERRQLTVMFCDLVGSTALSTRFDPEDLRELIGDYHRAVADMVGRFDGFVAKYMGDGVLIYFGYPQAHEDDAERAVRAGLAVIEAVGRLPAREDLRVRLGIATGLAVVGDLIGEGAAQERGVVGETPNLAARLQAQAPPNGIIISAGTHRLTAGLFDSVSLGTVLLKGFPVPTIMWQVLGESVAESRFDALHARAVTPMVGRDREFGLLMHCWERAGGGEAQVVLISGEAGVGKSRLLHAMRTTLEPSGPLMLTLYCSPYHQASALHPVINYYERLAGITHDDTPRQKLAKLETLLLENGAVLEQTAPILATLLSISLGARYAPLNLTPEQLKEQILHLLIRRVRDISLQRPVLCLVEDAHWIDPTTSELLSRMIPALKTSRMLLIVTSRKPTENFQLQHETPLVHLPLARLDRQQAEELLRHNAAGRPLSPKVSAEIIARADGIPLFVEELSKAVMEFGLPDENAEGAALHGSAPEAVVPATLHDSLMARLDRMSLAKPVVQFAAVLGRVFTVQLLSAAAPRHWQPIETAITALASAEIILPVQLGANPTYQFKHALLQDVAYQSLLRTTRREYHGRIAHVIAEQFRDIAETQPEIVARHFTEAGLPDKAVGYWLKAGQHATRLSSNLDAISHFERGMALLYLIDDSSERARIEYKFCLALLTPLIAAKGYTAPELERIFERALLLNEEIGDAEEIFPALYSRQVFELVTGRFDRAAVHAEEAIQLAKRNPSSDSAAFAGRLLATLKLFRGETTSASEQLTQFLALYDPARHGTSAHKFGQDHFVVCASYLTMALWHVGFVDQARVYSERTIEYARSLGHSNTLQFALAYGGAYFAALCRDLKYLQSTSTELLEIGKAHVSPSWSAAATGLHGKLLFERGHTSEGIATLQAGIRALAARGSTLWQPAFCAWLAAAHAARGEVSQGLAALEMGREAAAGGAHWLDAELHRVEGELLQVGPLADHARAEAHFLQALAVARAQASRMLELRTATSLARLWRSQGRAGEARALLQPVVAWFTEGHDTTDLREAVALLRMFH